MPHTLPHSSLQLLSRGDALQTRTLPHGTTKKQQLKEPLKQHHEKHMDAEQDSEGAQRHTDGAESKWHMVLEKEANMQALDEQISEIHTSEHRAAINSTTELVHGRARVPLSQTWNAAVDEGSLRVLYIMVSILATAAQLKSVPGVVRMTLIGLIIWHAVMFLTYVAWMGRGCGSRTRKHMI